MKTGSIVAQFALIAILAACSGGAGQDIRPEEVVRGERLFNTGGPAGIPCASCHSLDGADLVGPSLEGIGDRAGDRIPGLSPTDYIRQSIVTPSAFLVKGFDNVMPQNYGQLLEEEEIEDLIVFLTYDRRE
jgi:cytochrome c2